jgi:glycosyltransferase involved in cell wall biosynthesis
MDAIQVDGHAKRMTGRIRVLHVLTTLGGFGGIQDYVANLVTRIDPSRFEVEVACGPDAGPCVERVRSAGIPIHRMRLVRAVRPWTDLCGLVDVIRLLRAGRYDVVHTHMSKGAFLARLAARLTGVPLVVFGAHNVGVIYFRGTLLAPLFWLIDRVMGAGFTDVLISDAEYLRREVLRLRMIRPSKIVTVPAGIDLARLEAQSKQQLTGLPGPEQGLVVGTVSRLAPEKGLLTLVRAAPRILQAVPSTLFVIAGDGPQRGELEQAVRQAGLQQRFLFPGAVPQVAGLFRRLDIFVLPSRTEGLPIALMEAMACGCAAVASDVGGVSELIVHGESGLLVPAGNPESLADALITLLKDGALREQLGSGARRIVEAKFAVEAMVRGVESVYMSRLGPGKHA